MNAATEMWAKKCAKQTIEIERLRALVLEAAETFEGDGEYPETAKRFRVALG